MICLPQISVRRWPIMRATRSVDAPGVNGTTHRMGFEGKLSADCDVSAPMHALAPHNDNASHVAFIDRLRESSSELIRFGVSALAACRTCRLRREDREFGLMGSEYAYSDPINPGRS